MRRATRLLAKKKKRRRRRIYSSLCLDVQTLNNVHQRETKSVGKKTSATAEPTFTLPWRWLDKIFNFKTEYIFRCKLIFFLIKILFARKLAPRKTILINKYWLAGINIFNQANILKNFELSWKHFKIIYVIHLITNDIDRDRQTWSLDIQCQQFQ